MAELADAPDLGSGGITVQVQVLLPAPAGSAGSPISGVGIKNPNFINTTVYFGFIFIICTISSVHNGFQLWTLDFFMLKSLFSFLDMYRSRFFCSFLFCLGKAVMPSDIVRQHPFGFQQCDYVFCHRRRFRYIPQSGSKS